MPHTNNPQKFTRRPGGNEKGKWKSKKDSNGVKSNIKKKKVTEWKIRIILLLCESYGR